MTLPEFIALVGWEEAERRFKARSVTTYNGGGLQFAAAGNPVDGHYSALAWVQAFCIALTAACHRQKFEIEDVEANLEMIRALAADANTTAPLNKTRRYSSIYNQNGVERLPRGGWLRIGMRAEDAAKHGRNWEGWGFKKDP